MLSSETFRHVQQLLARGESSQRSIARQLGINRNTVGAIARGTRPDYDAMRRMREQREVPPPSGPKRRCPTCGALIYPPCVACRVREEHSHQRSPPRRPEPLDGDGDLALALRPPHQARYEQVRARRLAEQARRCA